MNEAHHEPPGSVSYNPDESVTNRHTFQNLQGRFIPPKVSNKLTQWQQQQQSSSEEGSKENTILNGPRHQKEMSAQDYPSGPADGVPQGSAPTAPTHTSQTGGPPQAPPVNNQNMEGCSKMKSSSIYTPRSPGSTGMQWNHQWVHRSTWRIW